MRVTRLSLIFQICFWFLFFLFQVAMAGDFLPVPIALMFAGLNCIFAATAFYLNSLWFFPRFFEKKKYWLYLLLNLVLMIVLSHIFFIFDKEIIINFKDADIPRHMPRIFPYFRIFSLLIFVFFISLITSLLRVVQKQEANEKQLAREKLDTEVQLLKAQINPHFIFNSMNNIYSLAYSKSDQTPDAVLKLSDMMRYIYYDCNRDEVSLGSEIEYLRNYIAFQQMKSPHKQNIEFDVENVDESIRIAPMLFIPFVENSFKYSNIEDIKDAFVKISISTDKNELCFSISNSHPEKNTDSGSGTGIKNVKTRLELTYPDTHKLSIQNHDSSFEVEMKIRK